jgi:hypothetical protein
MYGKPEQRPSEKKSLQFNYIAGFTFARDCGIAHALKLSRLIRLLKSKINFYASENTMRSELVFGAMTHVSNRFLLAKLAAMATRKLHKPNTRIEETMSEVLVRFSHADPIAGVPETGNVQRFRRAA